MENSQTNVDVPHQYRSTRQLLVKIPNFPCLYRHETSGVYYAIKKLRGRRKEHTLGTTDRQSAERKLKEWVANMDRIDPETEKMTLGELVDKFSLAHQGKAARTRATNDSIVKTFKRTWRHGLGMRVSDIKPSHLNEWLALHEGRLMNTSYNRYAALLKQLFEIAVADRIIASSPHERVKTPWKRPQTPLRHVPTAEQFRSLVENIRGQKCSGDAENTADFLEFLGLAGLGQAEASALTWGDVDMAKGTISIRRRKTGTLYQIPIYEHLRPLLEKLRQKAGGNQSPTQPVLRIKDGKRALQAACKRLGVPHFSQRNLRQHLIGRLWKAGVDKKLIAKWQGHQDGGTLIMETYTEVFGSDDDSYEKQQLAKLGTPG